MPRPKKNKPAAVIEAPAVLKGAPAVIDAAMYLDALQAAGHQVRLILCVGKVRVSGRTILEAVESLKGKVKV